MKMKRVLLAGESWMSYTTHVKGFDSFYTSVYETGEKWLKAALEKGGIPGGFSAESSGFGRIFHLLWKKLRSMTV